MEGKKIGAFAILGTMIIVPICAWALTNTFENSKEISSLKSGQHLRGRQLDRIEKAVYKLLESRK